MAGFMLRIISDATYAYSPSPGVISWVKKDWRAAVFESAEEAAEIALSEKLQPDDFEIVPTSREPGPGR